MFNSHDSSFVYLLFIPLSSHGEKFDEVPEEKLVMSTKKKVKTILRCSFRQGYPYKLHLLN